MRAFAAAILLLAGGLVSCSECKAPEGCLRAGDVDGTCQCLEWQVAWVENVPVRFVVLSVVYRAPGSLGQAGYGPRGDASGLRSEVGARWRSLVRAGGGSEQVGALGRLDVGQPDVYTLHPVQVAYPVTATSGAVTLEPPAGVVLPSMLDVPATEQDYLEVWVNPVATVTTDFAGNRTVDWSWSGSCFGKSCEGALTVWLAFGEITGTVPHPAGTANEMFLATLSDAERAELLRYHPLLDPPGRDPATLASDARFLSLTRLQVPNSIGTIIGNELWTPCAGTLTDADFPVLHEAEIPFGDGTLVVQHSVQSISPICTAQSPRLLLMAGSQCAMEADFYVDRAFGTVLGVPTSVSAGCTSP